ncbi:chemotaxis protein CheB [Plantactinospora sp. BB1]|uniref:chemotaxis protein CheB n=1 Tax=Plantactinospora sp. BB1 TaxID=2071627 RepID=UPI000D1529F1|nr:chemotaxis protein CheB [Plantactinospora sp. BB1]AVT41656.1 chemotaxis protein CheB [Plantactinospora sp. BB1]
MAQSRAVNRDLVVVGASAGGVEALRALVAGLPPELAAAVLVVLHMPAGAESALPVILGRCSPLPTAFARDGEPMSPGRLYIAVPDRHLLVKDGHLLLSRAPKQNRARPAVDALFRSAARWYGPRTVGVVLSGSLDDGAAGLAALHAAGGICVVQDPADAVIESMPRAALAVVPEAVVGPAERLGAAIGQLVAESVTRPAEPSLDSDLITETDMAQSERRVVAGEQPGRAAPVSCPDCSGGMRAVQTGAALHYACHVGHIWSPQTLLAAQQEKIEQALWTAVSMLEEQANIHRALAERAGGSRAALTQTHQLAAADEVCRAAEVIRKHFPEFLPELP